MHHSLPVETLGLLPWGWRKTEVGEAGKPLSQSETGHVPSSSAVIHPCSTEGRQFIKYRGALGAGPTHPKAISYLITLKSYFYPK